MIEATCNSSLEFAKKRMDRLELMFALNDVDLDLSQYYETQNPEEILNDEHFKKCLNELYSSFNRYNKADFFETLSTDWQRRKIYFDTQPEQMKSRLKIFEIIEDENKYQYADLNILAGALEFDAIEDDKDRVQTLLYMHKRNPRDRYVSYYLSRIKNNEKEIINLSAEEVIEFLEKAEISEDDMLSLGMLNAIPKDQLKGYLTSAQKGYVNCVNLLSRDDLEEVLQNVTDQEYAAKLLLSINGDIQIIAQYFPHIEDEYIRAQITLEKTDNLRAESKEEAMDNIANYLRIKETFMSLPPEERASFLMNLGKDENKKDFLGAIRKDRNQIKESLMKHLDHDDRMKVISTMEYVADEDIKPYDMLAKQMILEYINDNFEITDEQEEKIFTAFNTFDVFFSGALNPGVYGQTLHHQKDIALRKGSFIDKERVIIDMLHERAHTLSCADFLMSGFIADKTFEEGAADTFAELVASHYFKKHPEIEIDGEQFIPKLPLVSQSTYFNENAVFKSMLYPLEESGADKKAIQEFLLGDKNKFFDLTLGEGISQRLQHDFMGHPIQVSIEDIDIVRAHPESFDRLRNESIYMIKNDKIQHLSEIASERSKEEMFRHNMAVNGLDTNMPVSAMEEGLNRNEKEVEER